jgi:hypothetical protein
MLLEKTKVKPLFTILLSVKEPPKNNFPYLEDPLLAETFTD